MNLFRTTDVLATVSDLCGGDGQAMLGAGDTREENGVVVRRCGVCIYTAENTVIPPVDTEGTVGTVHLQWKAFSLFPL